MESTLPLMIIFAFFNVFLKIVDSALGYVARMVKELHHFLSNTRRVITLQTDTRLKSAVYRKSV